jgi:hypothetical protein
MVTAGDNTIGIVAVAAFAARAASPELTTITATRTKRMSFQQLMSPTFQSGRAFSTSRSCRNARYSPGA